MSKAELAGDRQPIFHCFVCSKQVTRDHFQDGTIFNASGNYGSGVFDPMRGDVHLTIVVCDECMETRSMTVQYVTETRPRTTYTYKPWKKGDDA